MKVSIITIVRNGAPYIERTIRSISAQTYPNIEYVLIDGASTDSTLACVKPYRDQIDVLVSEPDKGISDAWNKGLALCTGEVVGLLNAGDEYYPSAVENAVAVLRHGEGIVYGDTELVDEKGRLRSTNQGRFSFWRYSGGLGFYHPSCFVSASLYRTIGGFDLSYRFAMDTDWLIRAYKSKAQLMHSSVRVRMLDDGISVKNRYRAYGDYLQALFNNEIGMHTVCASMIMTGARGLVRSVLRGR